MTSYNLFSGKFNIPLRLNIKTFEIVVKTNLSKRLSLHNSRAHDQNGDFVCRYNCLLCTVKVQIIESALYITKTQM